MNGCGRTFCRTCDEEMIHRDRRRIYESASALGQIVNRELPRTFTTGDVDLYLRRWRRSAGTTLLRLIEHKQLGQKFEGPQRWVLRDLDAVIRHATGCPAAGIRLDGASGVYVMQGEIVAERSGRRKTHLGPQRVWLPAEGHWMELPTEAEALAWLIAGAEEVAA